MPHLVRRWFSSWPFLVLLVAGILIWRRPDQWLHPYVWVEEGTVTLPDYLAHGWGSILSPVAGYLVIPAKVIFLIAASLSFSHLPSIEYWLTLIFTAGTIALVAFSPTRLRHPLAAALAVALLPTDSEVFAVSEYAFWWGAIWSFVAIFWDEQAKPRTVWRCVLVLVGGLSSPMAVPMAVVLGFRAAVLRKRADFVVLTVASLAAAVQCYTMYVNGALKSPGETSIDTVSIVTRFFGDYALGSRMLPEVFAVVLGWLVLAGGVVFAIARAKWRDPYFLMLVACLVASIAASVTRVPVSILNPFTAGPRYFFFPYMMLSWLLLYTLPEVGRVSRALVCLVLAGALVQFAFFAQRFHDRVSWRAEIRHCVESGEATYQLPVHYDGAKSRMWHVGLTGNQCKDLASRSLFP
ncbi:hypothetical protein SAMN02800694_0711 [Luteibacter sp. UNCMF331Sha3.1]|uniref:hypothetical protein n=1 Tax=Luteibacter sp. UNCMF331Sha3.1 TaxID=1502760 RepID=UPI0008C476C7|nr:hypothetical protein [Luteibacter sp. UNCMF331Sha3.1]SEM34193.1 hypothetical protein SAMN02800694_0711 [Luteibacter sp. UNCMF331Sha3.1]